MEEGKLTDMTINKIKEGLEDIKKGRVISLDSYAKKRRIKLNKK